MKEIALTRRCGLVMGESSPIRTEVKQSGRTNALSGLRVIRPEPTLSGAKVISHNGLLTS
jgi:hypothetical protein